MLMPEVNFKHIENTGPRTELKPTFLCVFNESRAMSEDGCWRRIFGRPLVVSGNSATKVELDVENTKLDAYVVKLRFPKAR